jgi:hypothetical protein
MLKHRQRKVDGINAINSVGQVRAILPVPQPMSRTTRGTSTIYALRKVKVAGE